MDLTQKLRLEVQMARNDAFVWDVSTWTGSRWAGPADTSESGVEWRDILAPSHNIKIKRGAKRDGLSLSLEAGLLSATVNDATVDPNTNPYIKMGTPIRLMYAGRNNVLANPSAEVGVTNWLKTSGRTLVRDTSTSHLGLASFKFTSANAGEWLYTENYTAQVGETWTASAWVKGTGTATIRVGFRDGSLSAFHQEESALVTLTGNYQRISITGTAPVDTTFVFLRIVQKTAGAQNLWVDGAMLEESPTLNDYTEMKGGSPVFTGVIKTVKVTYRNNKPQVFITAVDRVKDIANISRSGVVAGTFAQRVATLLGKHGIPYAVTGSSSLVLAQNAYDTSLMNHLQLAANTEQGVFYVDKSNVVQAKGSASTANTHTLSFTDKKILNQNTNLVINGTGEAYGGGMFTSTSGMTRDTVDNPDGVTAGWDTVAGGGTKVTAVQPFTAAEGQEFLVEVWLKANVPDSRIYVELRDQNGDHGTDNYSVNNEPSGANGVYPVGNKVVPTTWTRYVSRAVAKPGVTTLDVGSIFFNHSNGTETNAVQSIAIRVRDYNTATGIEYTDIQVAYDSEAMSNDIYVENLTESAGQSVHTKYGPYQNVTSIVTYGAYSEDIQTNFSTQAQVDAFAAAVLAEHDAPELRVDSVRFNAEKYIEKAAALEVFDTVNVEYSNESFHIGEDFKVLDIEHTITASNTDHTWIVDVGLLGGTQ